MDSYSQIALFIAISPHLVIHLTTKKLKNLVYFLLVPFFQYPITYNL